MNQSLLKARLTLFILQRHLRSLCSGQSTPARLVRSLRKQMVVSSVFRDAKYARVGDRIFIDPFAPYFPSAYCAKVFDNNSADTYPPKPNFAQISITNRCPCRCVHCHVKNTQEADLPRETILRTIEQIAECDFPLIFFVGGEPFSRFDDLVDFVDLARRNMDTRIFTAGVGATPERLRALRDAGLEGICVSLDHYDEPIHNQRRNHPSAFKAACDTIREAASVGFYVSAVCCTTRTMVRTGETFKVVDLAESLGAHSIQLNEIRPVGRALESKGYDFFLTDDEKGILIDYYRRTNRSRRRIAIVMPWYNEEPCNIGCTATSAQQAYIDGRGNVQPCPLLKAGLGNVATEDFRDIWNRFRSRCGHPVRECLVRVLAEELGRAPELPLPPARTYELWPELCRTAPSDIFARIHAIKSATRGTRT